MPKIKDIYEYLTVLAPLELQYEYDNSGFLFGRGDTEVNCVLLALDVTDAVIEEAAELGAQLIVSHHPLIWSAPKAVTDSSAYTARLLTLAEKGIGVISMHTNFDKAMGGVNDVLIRKFCSHIDAETIDGCGRIGQLDAPVALSDFLPLCRERLGAKGLRYFDAGRAVHRLGVLGGAGADCLREACNKGCDTYITADIKYHQFLEAAELKINLIDADHFYTENPAMHSLCSRLSFGFPEIDARLSKAHSCVIDFA